LKFKEGDKVYNWTILNLALNEGKKRWLVKCICGKEKIVSQEALAAGRSKSCGCKRGRDLTGQVFGNLTVIMKAVRGDKVRGWVCKCICGNQTLIRAQSLIKGDTTSCGCVGLEKKKEVFRKLRKEPGRVAITGRFGSYKHSAKKRGFEFHLTRQEFEELVKQQCFYCDVEPQSEIRKYNNNPNYSKEAIERSIIKINGIDRVDSSKGYFKDNCVPCCKNCNIAKSNLSQVEFYDWLSRLLNKQINLGTIQLVS